MARCEVCGKKNTTGNSISHSHIATKRKFKANIQKKRNALGEKVKICTRCIKAQNKINK